MKKIILLLALSVTSGLVNAQTAFGTKQIIASNAYHNYLVYLADLDSDDDMDVLTGMYNDVDWYKNDGNGTFVGELITNTAWGVNSVYAADLDNDGDSDVLSSSVHTNVEKIVWYQNNGNGDFGEEQILTTSEHPWFVLAADLDSDGYSDVLFSAYTNPLAWFKNNGNGSFGNKQIILSGLNSLTSCYTLDLDNDGDLDILTSYDVMGNDRIVLFKNNGNGSFTNQLIITSDYLSAVYPSDVDKDGYLDVLYGEYDEIYWLKNNGNGTFASQQILINYYYQGSMITADLNKDGNFDIIADGYNSIVWYFNAGNGNFIDYTLIDDNGSKTLFTADLDSDGDIDILRANSASSGSNDIAWYSNLYNNNYSMQSSICNGDSIFMLEQWLHDQGNYTDTFINSFGGDSIVNFTLNVLPVPNDFNITGPLQVEEYSVQTYSVPANSQVNYTFEVQHGNILSTQDNSVEVQWGENSIGWIIVTATFPETGCHTTSYLPVTVGTGGIDESLASKVKLYPNPAKDFLYIESVLPDLSVEITDPAGKTVLQSIDPVIGISSLKQGIYIVKVFDKQGLVIKIEKLIVN